MSMQQLKSMMDPDKMVALEDVVALSAEARTYINEFEALDLEVPEFLTKSSDALREEAARRTRAADVSRLRQLENEIEGLKSAVEKRKDRESQLAALQKKLGLSVKSAVK